MSPADVGHGEFRELAAGYALNALDPADEERFLQHAAACPDCLEQIAQFQEVAAALAETAPTAEPGSDLGNRILAATQHGPAGSGRTDTRPAQTEPTDAGSAQSEPGGTRPADTAPEQAGSADTGPPPAGPKPTGPPPAGPTGTGPTGTGPTGTEPTGTEPAEAGTGTVVPLRPRQRLRRGVVAAAAVLVAVGGIWGGLAATSGGAPAPLAACSRPHACSEVPLVATDTHRVAAKVVVLGHEVWMLPGVMTANPKDEIYVLWQVAGSGAPRAVGSFSVLTGSHAPIRVGGLTAPYLGTKAFAVSLEHGRTIPAAPSNMLAVGRVS